MLAEDRQDNPGFTGNLGAALTELVAQRLCWPADQRPVFGAALHAKIVVVDRYIALITSANLTKRAAGATSKPAYWSAEATSPNASTATSPNSGTTVSCARHPNGGRDP